MGKRILLAAAMSFLSLKPACAANRTDIEDPMYLGGLGDFGSKTSLDFGEYFQAREIVEYGFSNRFSLAADLRWRRRNGDRKDGFSNLGLMGTYRAGQGD
ncbi:MAG: hypothetical protein LBB08_01345, partial [Rickettsiales bacterium]|nr:hypothetical protein [Rickettsiales bacterium]